MKLTRFLKLKRAIDSLDPHAIGKRLWQLDALLRKRGLRFDPTNTAITQEGIFYIEPETGIATKVIAYIADHPVVLTSAQRANLAPDGYTDQSSIESFHPYHLMRCNTLTMAEKAGWTQGYRIAKRLDGNFYYRIVQDSHPRKPNPEVYQEIDNQELYVCENCLWKATSIIVGGAGVKKENFKVKSFFDVNLMRSWNSLGELSKDVGFSKDMYPGDWQEITRIRKEQTQHQCEYCFDDLSHPRLRPYLYVHSTDHVEDREGYMKLNCLCISCVAELPEHAHVKKRAEWAAYQKVKLQFQKSDEEKANTEKTSRTGSTIQSW